MRFRSALVFLVVLAMLAGACGDDGSTSPDVTQSTTGTTAPGATTSSPATSSAETTTTVAATTTTEAPEEDPATLWVADWNGNVGRIDLRELSCDVAPVGLSADNVLVAFGSLWVSDCLGGQLVRFDPQTLEETGRLDLGACPWVVAADADAIWVALGDEEVALAIDPATGATVDEWEIPGMTAFAAWNPTIGSDGYTVYVRSSEIQSIDDLVKRVTEKGKVKKIRRRGRRRVGISVVKMTESSDPRMQIQTVLRELDLNTGDVSTVAETYGHVAFSGTKGENSPWAGVEFETETLRLIREAVEHIYRVPGINQVVVNGHINVVTRDGLFLQADPNQLAPGAPLPQWLDDGPVPNLQDDPAVTTTDLNVCGPDFGFGQATWMGEMELQRQIESFTPNGFASDPPATEPLIFGGASITECGMDFSVGSGAFYAVLNGAEEGDELDFYVRQGDTLVYVEAMAVDAGGRATFPLPDFAALGIDETAEYGLFAVPAGEEPNDVNCRVTFNIQE